MNMLDVDRAKQVLVELIRAAGGEWTGLTKLYKAFYLAHLYYADSAPGYLTNWPIVRMPNGPGVESGDELLTELVLADIITRQNARIGPYPTTTYRVTTKEHARATAPRRRPQGDPFRSRVRAGKDRD